MRAVTSNSTRISGSTKSHKIVVFAGRASSQYFFIIGLIFVSLIKNETRNLQKEISNLQASIKNLNLDLHQN